MADTTISKKTTPAKPKALAAHMVSVLDLSGKELSSIELPTHIFDVKASDKLLSQYVRVYLANQRQGTAKAKTRSEVNATTKKVYRQKGTGRARHGARTAALFVGGGATHGPQPRDHSLKLNKKQKSKALLYSLSIKAQNKNIRVINGIESLTGKTKEIARSFKNFDIDMKKVLVVYAPGQGLKLRKLLANIDYVEGTQDRLMNAYTVMNARNIVFTKEGFDDFLTFKQEKTS